MSKVPDTVGDSPAASAAGMPPPVDPGSDSDSDQDNYFHHEPQFVLHAVDDRRRPPAPAPALLPIQHRPAPERLYYREPDRVERLSLSLVLPQAVLCFWNLALAVMMICAANNPETQTNLVWVVVCSALIMLFHYKKNAYQYRLGSRD
ncbi:unnamed protein product [Urochloa humidicola]